MGQIIHFPAKARWALWEAALVKEYLVVFPLADCQQRAQALVSVWMSHPDVAKFGAVEKYALNGLGFKFNVGIPPSPLERRVMFAWLDQKGEDIGD